MNLLRVVICVVAAACCSACSQSHPSTQDIRNALQADLPGYSIDDIQCQSFEDRNQEGTGRESCTGRITLGDDLYAPLSSDRVDDLLMAKGIPQSGTQFFYRRHPTAIYARSTPKGFTTEIDSECAYYGQAKGWNIQCRNAYQKPTGDFLSTISGNYVLKDTEAYSSYIQQVKADYDVLDGAFASVQEEVEKFFSPGKTMLAYQQSGRDGAWHPQLSAEAYLQAKIGSPLVWTGAPGFLGKKSSFKLLSKYTRLYGSDDATFCGYPKGVPKDDVLFSGSIFFNESSGQFYATVEMMNRYAWYQNTFNGCGRSLTWSGSSWSRVVGANTEERLESR